jgi:hypothetical protein
MNKTIKLTINCLHKSRTRFEQITDQENLKTKINELISNEGHESIVILDDEE